MKLVEGKFANLLRGLLQFQPKLRTQASLGEQIKKAA